MGCFISPHWERNIFEHIWKLSCGSYPNNVCERGRHTEEMRKTTKMT